LLQDWLIIINMEIYFKDAEKQELYEKLFTIYWNHYTNNQTEYYKKFEKLKLENLQSLQPENTILGKIFRSKSLNFVDEGLSEEHIDLEKLHYNMNTYRITDPIPILKTVNVDAVNEYSKKYKKSFTDKDEQKLYESLYLLMCRKLKINPKINSVYYNAIYDRCYAQISDRKKYINFNLKETARNDRVYMQLVLKGLGFEYKKKETFFTKNFPLFDVQYPFWSIPDFALRIASWFGLGVLLETLFKLENPGWYFLSFLLSQVIYLGLVSMFFKTGRM